MRKVQQYLAYLAFRGLVLFFAICPFRLLYVFSDGLAFLLRGILRYRRTVIRQNLLLSFPDRTPAERHQFFRAFYQNLSDVLLETVKGFSMSREQFARRYRFVNPDVVEEQTRPDRLVFVLATHVANWEWGAPAIGFQVEPRTIGIYKPLRNVYIDSYIRRSRAQFGMHIEPMQDVKTVLQTHANTSAVVVFISDQTPSNPRRAHWFHFLHQPTPFMRGTDGLARRLDAPVVYARTRRVRRGYYELEFELLFAKSRHLPNGAINHAYQQRLEADIQGTPADWLWSHRRWKHQMPTRATLIEPTMKE